MNQRHPFAQMGASTHCHVSPVDGQRRIIDGGRIIAPADLQDELFVALRRKQRKRLIAEQRLDEDIKLRGPHCDEGGHADDKIIYRTNIPHIHVSSMEGSGQLKRRVKWCQFDVLSRRS